MPSSTALASSALLCMLSLPALAASDIDVIYGDEIAHKGEWSSELAARWSQPARVGTLPAHTLWQAVGEVAYGVNDQLSIGVKLPLIRSDGHWRGEGAYAEIKYLSPHGADGFYWGAEIELGSVKVPGEERAAVAEAFPIFGYRAGRWHLIGNPGLEYSAEGEDRGWAFAPKAKLSYQLNERHALGIEYHVDAGKFGDFAPRSKRSEMAYLTWDAQVDHHPLSVALGHGATHSSDRWALRIGIELDD
jgi:hypothetical protein